MIAGLATQVLFTTIFCILLTIVCFKIRNQLAEDKKLGYIIGKRQYIPFYTGLCCQGLMIALFFLYQAQQ